MPKGIGYNGGGKSKTATKSARKKVATTAPKKSSHRAKKK